MQNIFVLAGNIGHTVPIFLQVPQVKRLDLTSDAEWAIDRWRAEPDLGGVASNETVNCLIVRQSQLRNVTVPTQDGRRQIRLHSEAAFAPARTRRIQAIRPLPARDWLSSVA
jgi:hypothetical protein